MPRPLIPLADLARWARQQLESRPENAYWLSAAAAFEDLAAIRLKSAARKRKSRHSHATVTPPSRTGHVTAVAMEAETATPRVSSAVVADVGSSGLVGSRRVSLADRVRAMVVTPVEEVIAHYLQLHPTAKPGAKERRLIEARLKEGFTVADLCAAIDGQHRSPWHNGTDPQGGGKKYLTLELAVRDSAKVNQFREITRAPSSAEQVARVAAAVIERRASRNGTD
jgi:hypothetical protein